MRYRGNDRTGWRGRLRALRDLFTIKTKFEAFVVIYGLGVGAVERGLHYQRTNPGWIGWVMFCLPPLAVFMAGARILDSLERERG